MDVTFRGQHLTIDEAFRDHAGERLQKIARHLPQADRAIVDVRREAKGDVGRFVVQVTVSANGTFLRAEERNYDMLAAIDAASDVLARQAKRFRERQGIRGEHRVDKDHRLPMEPPEEERAPRLPADAEIIGGRVVRVKRFDLKPMSEEEAVEQMELLGHSFFLFHDGDSDSCAVIYRRNDGDYGMITRDKE